ncbi:hypothetical protein GCM10022206_32290 [Streptomyces chiangmaiensis]
MHAGRVRRQPTVRSVRWQAPPVRTHASAGTQIAPIGDRDPAEVFHTPAGMLFGSG